MYVEGDRATSNEYKVFFLLSYFILFQTNYCNIFYLFLGTILTMSTTRRRVNVNNDDDMLEGRNKSQNASNGVPVSG